MLYQNGYFCEDLDRTKIVQVDLKKAIEFNNKAMQLDLPRAMNNLGLIFYNNKSINPANPG
jgi:TPR repeat protein